MQGAVERSARRFYLPTAVVAVLLVAWWVRIVAIGALPEPDADARAHLAIARKLVLNPWQLSLHWVWLPGYHYYLRSLLTLGVEPESIRYVNAGLAAVLSLVLLGYARLRASHRAVPWLAALFCALAPIVNLLGISAQQETLFSIAVLACAWGIDAGRFWLAGVALAVASMIRYEAWGAVGVVSALAVAQWVPALARRLPSFARAPKRVLVVVVPPLGAIASWIVWQRVWSGKWFGQLLELYRFTSHQRDALSHGAVMDWLWFPLLLPLFLFGLALPLALIGVRRAFSTGFWVPLGIGAFLTLSYASKGSLGSGRYFDALTPFVCWCAAEGIAELSARRKQALPWLSAATAVCLLVLTGCLLRWTFGH